MYIRYANIYIIYMYRHYSTYIYMFSMAHFFPLSFYKLQTSCFRPRKVIGCKACEGYYLNLAHTLKPKKPISMSIKLNMCLSN